ncbi:hypothetical protein EYC80_004322 [Monilinia laxa]|uniref:Uncharacterized protein n=1 Tax=Monilinia laxa TaxID=61186 RepID=A0A5N6KN11_MONLA|nr:hypothetical protein EYC80_004322 [Monilinia laxa]
MHLMQSYAILCNPMQSYAILYNPIQSNPIQSNPIRSNPICFSVLGAFETYVIFYFVFLTFTFKKPA